MFSVYPCVYREHEMALVRHRIVAGLSLCIQGTHFYRYRNRCRKRFIPVYTGNTFLIPPALRGVPVYPCVYREHSTGIPLASLTMRFIPVYTGNTHREPDLFAHVPVYPCVYREHYFIFLKNSLAGGLSLCIQGTLICSLMLCPRVRFIPVYTGNTIQITYCNIKLTVYPCVYREHFAFRFHQVKSTGLSLCIQGTH